jgi:hypothetical protein
MRILSQRGCRSWCSANVALEEGVSAKEMQMAFAIALVVSGFITIPHLRY